MKINEIHLNPDNPRFIKDDKFEKLKKSIKEFPKMMELRPIIIDDSGKILGGNMRYRALIELGYQEIPKGWVVKASELTEEEKKRFIIADNIPYGEFDYEKLGNEWDEVKLEDWGMDLSEINIHFEPEAEEDGFDVDKAVEDAKEPICKLGDIWQLGKHRIMCGDSTKREDVEKLMDGKKADMVFTDPPYGVDYSEKNTFLNAIAPGNRIQTPIENDNIEDYNLFYGGFLKHFREILNDYNSFYITISGQKLLQLLEELKKLEYKTSQILVWCKNNHVLGRQDYANKHELITYGWVGKHKFYGGFQTTIWEVDKPLKSDLHPTMKPIELCSRAINNSSKNGMIVLDLFLGSGSTLIACEQLNRICYGMEIDSLYVSVILDRWSKFTGKDPIRLSDGKLWSKIKEE